MGARAEWVCFLSCPGEAAACPIAVYLNLHDCPALAEVRVPAEFLPRARHIWAHAGTTGDLSEGELEYLATGKLPGADDEELRRDDAA
jgi:hypothetical protein